MHKTFIACALTIVVTMTTALAQNVNYKIPTSRLKTLASSDAIMVVTDGAKNVITTISGSTIAIIEERRTGDANVTHYVADFDQYNAMWGPAVDMHVDMTFTDQNGVSSTSKDYMVLYMSRDFCTGGGAVHRHYEGLLPVNIFDRVSGYSLRFDTIDQTQYGC